MKNNDFFLTLMKNDQGNMVSFFNIFKIKWSYSSNGLFKAYAKLISKLILLLNVYIMLFRTILNQSI